MPTFAYTGKLTNGEITQGILEAASREEALSLLRDKKVKVFKLKAKNPALHFSFHTKVNIKDLSRFTRRFAVMSGSGLPLLRSLEALARQTEQPHLRKAAESLLQKVRSGSSLAAAMEKQPRVFDKLYCSMVRAGESAGILGQVLAQIADYQEKTSYLQGKIRAALAYPAIVSLVAIGALAALVTFVVPMFAEMLHGVGADLPMPTKLVMEAAGLARKYLIYALAASAGLTVIVLYFYRANARVHLLMDNLWLHLPLLGDLARKSAISRFARTLSSLLQGGVSLTHSLEITAGTAGNSVIEKGALRALEEIKGGKNLTGPLEQTGVFPAMVIEMIATGEETGNLPQMLSSVSDYYEKEVDSAIGIFSSIIEPVLLVVMGIVVGAILVAMYLPMFELIGKIE